MEIHLTYAEAEWMRVTLRYYLLPGLTQPIVVTHQEAGRITKLEHLGGLGVKIIREEKAGV